MLLVLLVHPALHDDAKFCDALRVAAAEVPVDDSIEDAFMEAIDDVLIGDVGNGGAHFEEVAGVGA